MQNRSEALGRQEAKKGKVVNVRIEGSRFTVHSSQPVLAGANVNMPPRLHADRCWSLAGGADSCRWSNHF